MSLAYRIAAVEVGVMLLGAPGSAVRFILASQNPSETSETSDTQRREIITLSCFKPVNGGNLLQQQWKTDTTRVFNMR